jgi:hypothetical protein
MNKIVCSECASGPFDGRALYRDKGALFYQGWGRGKGPLYCAACAPDKIKRAIVASARIDRETKALAA